MRKQRWLLLRKRVRGYDFDVTYDASLTDFMNTFKRLVIEHYHSDSSVLTYEAVHTIFEEDLPHTEWSDSYDLADTRDTASEYRREPMVSATQACFLTSNVHKSGAGWKSVRGTAAPSWCTRCPRCAPRPRVLLLASPRGRSAPYEDQSSHQHLCDGLPVR